MDLKLINTLCDRHRSDPSGWSIDGKCCCQGYKQDQDEQKPDRDRTGNTEMPCDKLGIEHPAKRQTEQKSGQNTGNGIGSSFCSE